ncbi:MAG: hypothetical protein QGH94_17440, partial [Phycisphaerae bacterium]|nr:hypothetical protein [Phycisphaerae bacterium]
GMQARSIGTIVSRSQRQGRPEKLNVVPFIRFPYPGAVVQVFCEIHQDTGEIAERLVAKTERIIDKILLSVQEHTLSVLHELRKA